MKMRYLINEKVAVKGIQIFLKPHSHPYGFFGVTKAHGPSP